MNEKNGHLLTEHEMLVLQAVRWNNHELISRHVEFQVRNQMAIGESRLEFESEVTATDYYLSDIMEIMVKFWKTMHFIRKRELRKKYRGPSSEPSKPLYLKMWREAKVREDADIGVKQKTNESMLFWHPSTQ